MSSSVMFYLRSKGLLIALSVGIIPAFAGSNPGGLSNFYKIDQHVWRGAQPDADGFAALAKMGVKTVLDLRGPEHSEADEKQIVESLGMHYVSVPMLGMHTPTEDQISRAMSLMNDTTAWPVFVHCQRGADRTGAVVACYRIGHDHWDNKKALSEARSFGMSWYQRALQSYVKGYEPPVSVAAAPAPAGGAAAAGVSQ